MKRNMQIRRNMKEQLPMYLFVSVVFLSGVVFGALMVSALSLQQQQELLRYVNGYFSSIVQNGEGYSPFSLGEAFAVQFKWLALIWFLGLSVVGLPLVLVLDFLKGVLIGFSVAFFAGQLSWKGVLFALVSIVPQNLVIIPAELILSVTAIGFALYIIKNRLLQRRGSVSGIFGNYMLVAAGMSALMLGAAALETYVSPGLLRSVSPMMLGA